VEAAIDLLQNRTKNVRRQRSRAIIAAPDRMRSDVRQKLPAHDGLDGLSQRPARARHFAAAAAQT
jgi:hypothetical protein